MSVVTRSSDSSVRKKSSITPTVMMIGASSLVSSLRQKLECYEEQKHNARIYFMPDVRMWRFLAKRCKWLFRLWYGGQIRIFSEVVRREYPRDCKVFLLIHKDSVVDIVCAVARKLVQQGEIHASEISILVLPSASASKITFDDIRRIASAHGLPENIPVLKYER